MQKRCKKGGGGFAAFKKPAFAALSGGDSYDRIVQQKIYDPDIQYAGIIVPAFADIVPDDELRE